MKLANNYVISIIFVYNVAIHIEIRMLDFDWTSFAFTIICTVKCSSRSDNEWVVIPINMRLGEAVGGVDRLAICETCSVCKYSTFTVIDMLIHRLLLVLEL